MTPQNFCGFEKSMIVGSVISLLHLFTSACILFKKLQMHLVNVIDSVSVHLGLGLTVLPVEQIWKVQDTSVEKSFHQLSC